MSTNNMLKPNTVLMLGFWLIILSFLGVPRDWKTWAYILTGVGLISVYASHLGRESIYKMLSHRSKADTFTDSAAGKQEESGPRTSETKMDG